MAPALSRRQLVEVTVISVSKFIGQPPSPSCIIEGRTGKGRDVCPGSSPVFLGELD